MVHITYVSWNWLANGSGVSNTDGDITSTVSANTTSGFSIVTYTGNSSSSATVGHGLGVAPAMILNKCRTGANAGQRFFIYHKGLSANNIFHLILMLKQEQVHIHLVFLAHLLQQIHLVLLLVVVEL
jgi:hypothetical protein